MIRSIYDRYETDVLFKQLVDALYHHIVEFKLTPTEIREAAMMAAVLHAQRHPAPPLFPGATPFDLENL
jgi:hypothetical protein